MGALLAWSIRNRWVVLFLTVLLAALGARAFLALPIDAVPDLTNSQVQVLTTAPALGALDIERMVTVPVERALTGLPRVQELRSLSRNGVSAVTVVFEDAVDPFAARQLVNERVTALRDTLPPGVGLPELGPPTTGLGEVYQFEVRGPGRSPMELRSVLEWQLAPRLRLVPGVAEVNTFGGELRAYEVSVDPRSLRARELTVTDVVEALERNHRIAGGGTVERGPEALLVRADGLLSSLEDLRQVVVARREGGVVRVEDLGVVRYAPVLRQGAASRDGRGEIVVGMAMMRLGENSRTVSAAVDRAVRELAPSLPEGVTIEPFYDRTALVERTISTVARNLLEGGLLVVALLFLLLRNLRAGLVAAAMIPLCMLGAFLGMRALGLSGNLMSLGALDFGLVVDGAIILLENALHHLDVARGRLGRALTPEERDEAVLQASLEVRGPTVFGEAIIALVYVPVLALEGSEGRMFGPMAWTVLFALGSAFVLSLTFVPALASLVLSREERDRPSPVVTALGWLYRPALGASLRRPWLAVAGALGLFVLAGVLSRGLGSEFVPRLDEGSLVIEAVRLPSTSLAESVRTGGLVERALRRFPEVLTVVTKTGRPEIANDPMGVEASDVFVMLHPRETWPGGPDREALVERMSAALRSAVPGVAFGFSQPIEMRTNELLSGSRGDLALRIYGEDLRVLGRLGGRAARILGGLRGAADVRVDRVEGLPVLHATPDRAALSRAGADVASVVDAIGAVGGLTAGTVLEGRRRYPLQVRIDPRFRGDTEALSALPVRAGSVLVPLGAVARFELRDEPVLIQREGTERRSVVQVNVRGRDLGGFAAEAQARVDRELPLPPGYRLAWGGQFENLQRATERLSVVVPLTLAAILGLLVLSFRRWAPALVIFLDVPFAATGGVFALWARGMPFSISAGVGFIALFGVSVLNGLVLVSQVRLLQTEGRSVLDAARDGALRRLRPVVTTALVASLGFLPMALATGAGAEVQRPLATVVVGGLVSSTLLTLLVLPALWVWLGGGGGRSAAVQDPAHGQGEGQGPGGVPVEAERVVAP
ncbi:MAG: efflux RND transporter permease subunit [Deltaproteobacteria bacterium]|nr:efflux RND transporter permease subunit [Deltaproteobacteria bacterium]